MNMRVAHLLRKYNPAEWGGTETAIQRLLEGLREQQVSSVVYCPRLERNGHDIDPLQETGCEIERFNAFVPVWGISKEQRRQQVSIGGNLMSLDLIPSLLRERDVSLIHAHTLGRLAGVARLVAERRKIPFVITIHGGALDMNVALKASLDSNGSRGFEWGKLFGLLLHSRDILNSADAIIACNDTEAARLRTRYPGKRILVQPHGIVTRFYEANHREAVRVAFPQIVGKKNLLCVSRIDPVKNQGWLVEQLPRVLQSHPDALLVLVGACTNKSYGTQLNERIRELGLKNKILFTGGLPPDDPRLLGLIQLAELAILSSVSETFGLVLLEAWAANTPVISSRTSGAMAVVRDGDNGFLFDLGKPETFHAALNQILGDSRLRNQLAANGRTLVEREYDASKLACRIKKLYEELIEEKNALRDHSR